MKQRPSLSKFAGVRFSAGVIQLRPLGHRMIVFCHVVQLGAQADDNSGPSSTDRLGCGPTKMATYTKTTTSYTAHHKLPLLGPAAVAGCACFSELPPSANLSACTSTPCGLVSDSFSDPSACWGLILSRLTFAYGLISVINSLSQ